MTECSVCGKMMDLMLDMPIRHEQCGHYACGGKCSDGKSGKCRSCASAAAAAAPVAVAAAATAAPRALRVAPAKPRRGGLFTWAAEKAATLSHRNMTVEEATDPFFLIGLGPAKVPVETLLQKGLDFNTLIERGIHMDHFLNNGYTIADLKKFPEVTPQLSASGVLPVGVEALKALDFRASHLRTHYTAMPYERVCAATGLNDLYLVNEFGLNFHPTHGIVSPGARPGTFDTEWTIDNLIYLGFTTMDDFLDKLHLTSLSQWYALQPTEKHVAQLDVRQRHFDRLQKDVVLPPVYAQVPAPVQQQRDAVDPSLMHGETRSPHYMLPPMYEQVATLSRQQRTGYVVEGGVLRLGGTADPGPGETRSSYYRY